MQIGIIGAGNIGSNVARQAARAGHSLKLSFSRDTTRLQALSDELGASLCSPAEAVAFGDDVVVSAPWSVLPAALAAAGHFHNKIVVDTTNQFGTGPMPGRARQGTSISPMLLQAPRSGGSEGQSTPLACGLTTDFSRRNVRLLSARLRTWHARTQCTCDHKAV